MAGGYDNLSGAGITTLFEHLDEFKSLPNYMNHLRAVYQGVLAELADSLVGQQIIREVRNDPTYCLDKISNDLGNEIMKSEYFLS